LPKREGSSPANGSSLVWRRLVWSLLLGARKWAWQVVGRIKKESGSDAEFGQMGALSELGELFWALSFGEKQRERARQTDRLRGIEWARVGCSWLEN